MSATNFNTRNDTYRKLLGNGLVYRVPRFQRDYSWSEDEWDDLWADIQGCVQDGGEPAHYMGYLVLQSSDERQFEIIDGQQRLTTLSLIVLAALANLKRLASSGRDVAATGQRMEGLRQGYIGYLDPVTLMSRSKLTLNRNNDSYYQTYLVPLADKLPQRGFKASEHALRRAFEWFDRALRDYVGRAVDPGLAIAQLIDRMSDRLFFTVITVGDELNAYKVFETLNARGVRLSATDLLKNYLFSVLSKARESDVELKALDDRWERIVGRLAGERLTDFLRAHWISRREFVRAADLFKTIRARVDERGEVFRLLNEMDEDVDAYLALVSPEGSDWSPEAKRSALLLRRFSVRQPLPLALAAKRVLPEQDFDGLMRALVIISFRYNVIGNLQTSEQERTYQGVAGRLARGELKSLGAVLEALRGVYPSDDSFRAAFAEKSIGISQGRNRQIVLYILGELERRLSGRDVGVEGDAATIEHVCPQHPLDGQWLEFSDRDVEELTSRLGNLTLLSRGDNKDLGRGDYQVKRPVYARSAFALTRDIAEHNDTWTPERLAARQANLAKTATAIWRIAQLS